MKFGAISWKINILLITAWLNLESNVLYIYDTYNWDYLPHTTFHFYFIHFQLKYRFPYPSLRFYGKITKRYSKIGFSRKCLKKMQKPVALFHKTIGSNNSFTLIESNFKFFIIAKFEFKEIEHLDQLAKCTQLWLLTFLFVTMHICHRTSIEVIMGSLWYNAFHISRDWQILQKCTNYNWGCQSFEVVLGIIKSNLNCMTLNCHA